MKRDELGDLAAFLAVCDERSFTRAAAVLGTSQSALSYTVRRLEERLGLRLLTRTTRNVTPTEAGERLAETLRPAFSGIERQLASLDRLRHQPAGLIRLTSSRFAARTILMPVLAQMMAEFPDLRVELSVDQRFTNIVKDRFDAGVRLGEAIEKDMVAVRIGPDIRMAVVGSPSYFAERPIPASPHDLTAHTCINLRMASSGGLYAWELERNGRSTNVRVDGQFTTSDADFIVFAAEAGLGLACLPEDMVLDPVGAGRLVRVLDEWCPPFAGYHLYYPSRRQHTAAFETLVEHLRWRG